MSSSLSRDIAQNKLIPTKVNLEENPMSK